jgi:hypothetical protein
MTINLNTLSSEDTFSKVATFLFRNWHNFYQNILLTSILHKKSHQHHKRYGLNPLLT